MQNHLCFKNWEIIPLWFSHSEVSQLYLKWEVIHLAVNGQELRLHSANCKTGKWWCASHPGPPFAKHLTTWLPSEAAKQGCSGKKKRPFKEFSKLSPCPLMLTSWGQPQVSPVTLLTSSGWAMQPSLVALISDHCEALNHFKKTQTQKLLMDTGMTQRTQQDHCEEKQDFMVETDPCQEGNSCKIDYNSISPLIVTSGKIIRHLHRQIGHYLEKHICTPELSTSSCSQALVSLSQMWNTFLKWHRGDWSTVPSDSPNSFHSFHWILSQAWGWQIGCQRKKV